MCSLYPTTDIMKILQLIFFSFILSGLIFTPTIVELSFEEHENLVNGRIGPDAQVVALLSPMYITPGCKTSATAGGLPLNNPYI